MNIAEIANATAPANQRNPFSTAFTPSPVKVKIDNSNQISATIQQRFLEYFAKLNPLICIVFLVLFHLAELALNRLLKNVGEAASARQKWPKKRSLHGVNEHFEAIFNAAMATQVVFQQPAKLMDQLWV
jgi:hypothetical protein